MILNNVRLVDTGNLTNIQINGNKIVGLTNTAIKDQSGQLHLNFENAIAFPGLINSHDHLDFNLFPQLGDKIYDNYTEWGKYIHENYQEEISKVLKIPQELREQWGVFKNLICGVTTVVNHGENVKIKNRLIHIHEQYYCLHSVRFEKKWRVKLNHPLKLNYPVVVHIGEGTNRVANREIDQLLRWNLLHKPLIGVHAVAMSERQAEKFKAVVWCPQSNYFLLNKTASIDKLKRYTPILFGTDSTLTSEWDIWSHIRLARKTGMLSDVELYRTLNLNPSTIWKTENGEIRSGNNADLVVAKAKDRQEGIEAFFSTRPEDLLLVVQQGNIRLFDDLLQSQLSTLNLAGFSKVIVNGTHKYVAGDVTGLIKKIREYDPEATFPVTGS